MYNTFSFFPIQSLYPGSTRRSISLCRNIYQTRNVLQTRAYRLTTTLYFPSNKLQSLRILYVKESGPTCVLAVDNRSLSFPSTDLITSRQRALRPWIEAYWQLFCTPWKGQLFPFVLYLGDEILKSADRRSQCKTIWVCCKHTSSFGGIHWPNVISSLCRVENRMRRWTTWNPGVYLSFHRFSAAVLAERLNPFYFWWEFVLLCLLQHDIGPFACVCRIVLSLKTYDYNGNKKIEPRKKW